MKKFILFGFLSSLVFADIKVDFIETKEVKIPEISGNYQGTKTFAIVCINGYKWLHSGISGSTTLSQMFTDDNAVRHAQPISCKNKD